MGQRSLCIQMKTKERIGWQRVARIFSQFKHLGEINCNTEDSGEYPRLYYPIDKSEKKFGTILWINDGITMASVMEKARTLSNKKRKLEVSIC